MEIYIHLPKYALSLCFTEPEPESKSDVIQHDSFRSFQVKVYQTVLQVFAGLDEDDIIFPLNCFYPDGTNELDEPGDSISIFYSQRIGDIVMKLNMDQAIKMSHSDELWISEIQSLFDNNIEK